MVELNEDDPEVQEVKKRKLKERQKREADIEIEKRYKDEAESRQKKKAAGKASGNSGGAPINVMQSGRMNAMMITKGKKIVINSEADKKAENEASELIQKMSEATQNDRESY
jgi:hypothetical protein